MNKTSEYEAGLVTLSSYLKGWLRLYRLRRSYAWSIQSVIFSLAACFGVGCVLILTGGVLRRELFAAWGLLILVSLASAWLASWVWPMSMQGAARLFDELFGLKERLSTALEFSAQPLPDGPGGELILHQRADAISQAAQVTPQRHLPLWLNPSLILLAVFLLGGNLLLAWRGEAQFQAALEARQFQETLAAEISRITEIRDALAADETLTPLQRQELLQPLDEAIPALTQAQSLEQAVSILAEAEAQLRALEDSSARQSAENLSQLGQGLSQQEGSALEAFGQALSDGDLPAAAQELEQLDLDQLGNAETQVLAEQLIESSQALASSNPDLAEALERAGESLRAGEAEAAAEALDQASQELRQVGGMLAQNQSAAQAAGAVSTSGERLLAAGQSAGESSASQSGQGSPAGDQGQSGENSPGQGSNASSQPGGDSNGSGAGRGEGEPGSGPVGEAGSSPISQGNQPGDGGLQPYEMIFSPQRLGGEAGEALALPESGLPGDQISGQGAPSQGEFTPSKIPYAEVYPYYAEIYRQAMQNGSVPPAYRDLVRRYFSSLEP